MTQLDFGFPQVPNIPPDRLGAWVMRYYNKETGRYLGPDYFVPSSKVPWASVLRSIEIWRANQPKYRIELTGEEYGEHNAAQLRAEFEKREY